MNTIIKQHNLCLIYLLGLAILVSVSSFEMDDEQEIPVIHSISKNHRRQHSLHHSSRGPNLTRVEYIGGPPKELRIKSIKDDFRYRQRSFSEHQFSNWENSLRRECSRLKPAFSKYLTSGQEADEIKSASYVTVYIESEDKSYSKTCGGTILDKKHILTAASCIQIKRPRVFVAPIRKRVNGILKLYPVYHASKFADDPNSPRFRDLLVLRIIPHLQFNMNVMKACLPERPLKSSDKLYQLGFGIIDQQTKEIPERLKVWNVRKEICPKEKLFPTNICFSHSEYMEMGNVCEGDFGAGLVSMTGLKLTISGVLSKASGPCNSGTFGYGIAIDVFVHKRDIIQLILETEVLYNTHPPGLHDVDYSDDDWIGR